MKKLMWLCIFVLLLWCIKIAVGEENRYVKTPTDSPFYVYKDSSFRGNHGIPSGWMGSFKSMKMSNAMKRIEDPTNTYIRITYDISKDTETTWAGIYWQYPVNNWADKKGSFNLTGFKKLKFICRGKGYIQTFKVGGITAQTENGDSCEAFIENIDLTDEWKEYTIDLKGLDLSNMIGLFSFATASEYQTGNIILELDEIRFEK